MISLLLDDVQIGFEEAETAQGVKVKVMVVRDTQSGISVRLPFVPEVARQIAAFLDDRPVIEVAHTLPPK